MLYLTNFKKKIVKYDLINKYLFVSSKKLPKLKKVILNFSYKNDNFKELASSLVVLKLITMQKGMITKAKVANISLKIKKGNPVGCKITLRKNKMLKFLSRLISEIFNKFKNIEKLSNSKLLISTTFLCQFKDCLLFWEFEKIFLLFKKITKLNITFVTTIKSKETAKFFFNLLKFPTKIFANITQWQSLILPRLMLKVQVLLFAFIKRIYG